MAGISKITSFFYKAIGNTGLVSKTNFVQKPEITSVFKPNLFNQKLFGDFFESSTKISLEGVKKLFPTGRIEEEFIHGEMKRIKRVLFFVGLTDIKKFKLWLHSVNLKRNLSNDDYKHIYDFMNMFNGKFKNQWLSESNGSLNTEKLALFVRSINHIKKLDYYKSLREPYWETCMDGIINRPKSIVGSLMRYKYDSTDINKTLSGEFISQKATNDAEQITKFLDTQILKHNLKLYRGESTYGLFYGVKLDDKGNTLGKVLEDMTAKIQNGKCGQDEIDRFIENYLIEEKIIQSRFLSTAITKDAVEKRYAKKVLWHIDAPKGLKGSMIECYNVERPSEAEILMQKGTRLVIKDAKYNFEKIVGTCGQNFNKLGLKKAHYNVRIPMRCGMKVSPITQTNTKPIII